MLKLGLKTIAVMTAGLVAMGWTLSAPAFATSRAPSIPRSFCGVLPVSVLQSTTFTIDAAQLHVVVADCATTDGAGAGIVLVQRKVHGHFATKQFLLAPPTYWVPDGLIVYKDKTLSLKVSGYRSDASAMCCPNVFATLLWRWTGERFQLLTHPPHHRPW